MIRRLAVTVSDKARCAGPAVVAHDYLLAWFQQTLEPFPRSQKFLLGDRI